MPKQENHARDGYDIDDILCKLTDVGFEVKLIKRTFNRYKDTLAWELGIMYPFIAYPLVVILSYMDVFTFNKAGGGVLIIAERR